MDLLLVLVAATVFPAVCLGFVLWMGRMEDTIPASVARSLRRPDPEPVLRIPAQRTDAPAPAVPVATDAPAPAVPVATAAPAAQAASTGT